MSPRSVFVKVAALSVVCLGVSPLWAMCSAPPSLEAALKLHRDVQTYTGLGSWFGNQGQYACALENFRAALRIQPDSAILHYLVGLSLYSSGDAETAITELQESIRIAPKVLKPHLVLADAFNHLQRNQEAQAQWRIALQIDPNSAVALDALSNSLIANGDYASAISLLRSVRRDETLSFDLARAYGKAGMLDQAADTLAQALRTHPSSLPLTSALITVYVNQSRPQDAVQLAAKAVRLHPGNPEVERLYLRVLVLNHDATVARPLGRKLLAARPHDFEFLYLNGILEREAGEYIAARQHLEEAIKLNPAHPNCRYNLGVVLAQLKDSAGARDQLEKSLALGATEPQVRFVLASVLRNLGATEPAQEQLKLYQQELQAATNSTLAAGKSRQAEEALTAGDAAKAVALYREAVEAKPDDALLDFKLALALDRTGDTAAEQAALDEAIRIDPTFALAQNQAGYMASNSGDFSSAEAHFRLAVQSAPGYAEAWLNLAAALGMESRFPEALDAVATSLKLDRNNPRALELQRGLANAQKQH